MSNDGLRRAAFGALAILGVVTRLAMAWGFPAGIEPRYYAAVADAFNRGEGLYGTPLNNYAPIWAGVILLVDRAARAAEVPFDSLVRTVVIGVDILSAAVLAKLAIRRGKDPWKVAALFLANPVSIWVTGFQGQFDGVSLLFLLLAILATVPAAGRDGATSRPIVFLALSIATKQITALHPVLWFERVRKRWILLLPYAVSAALFVPFLREWRGIRDHVLFYSGVPRSYGLSELVLYDDRFGRPVSLLCLAVSLAAAWRLRREPDLARACLVLFLVLLFLAPGFGTQYVVWPLTVGVLAPGIGYFLCTAATMAWTLGSHFGIPGSGRWMGHLAWLSIAFWLIREVRMLERPGTAVAAPENA